VSEARVARDALAAKIKSSHSEEEKHYRARRYSAALDTARWRVRAEHALQNMNAELAAASTVRKPASSRPSAPKDPRLERMEAHVRHALGQDRKVVNKLVGSTVHVGVPEDYQPR
jgi:hypothetical protein